MIPAGVPDLDDVRIPDVVRRLAGPEPIVPGWLNELGGLTFRIGTERFLKWHPPSDGPEQPDFGAEADRLSWAAEWITVPPVLDRGENWLLTRAIAGSTAVSPEWRARPAAAVAGIARGLRRLHDRLPVRECPYDWGVSARLGRLAAPSPDRVQPSGLESPPPVERLVVCPGDACAPNTLLHPDGRPAGHVDLGRLGRADRWADLAVCSWSLEWNFGPGWDGLFYDTYGVQPDADRIRYYRALWTAAD